jgi:hypothetical protein
MTTDLGYHFVIVLINWVDELLKNPPGSTRRFPGDL